MLFRKPRGSTIQRLRIRSLLPVIGMLICSPEAPALAESDGLSIEKSAVDISLRLNGPEVAGSKYEIESSPDLRQWIPWITTHESLVDFPDGDPGGAAMRFYRARLSPLTDEDLWKNQLHFPTDRFLSLPAGLQEGEVLWVKFVIRLDDPDRVVFQNSQRMVFHYDFVIRQWESFRDLSRAEFERIALHSEGQELLLGAVLYPPPPNVSEFGIQFVGQDPIPPETIREFFERVRSVVAKAPGVRALYLPTFEQTPVVAANPGYFADHGIPVDSTARWVEGHQTYSTGWAVGRLVYVPAGTIDAAYTDGRLRPGDILLTDAVPAEIPVLAGVISLSPATPNSHVAILSKSFGIPFAFLAGTPDQERARALDGRKIGYRATEGWAGDALKIIDLANELTPELEAQLLDLKTPAELQFEASESYGALSAPTDGLTPGDIRYFGGKAANFGFLRREIPDHSPAAIAFSFDLWDAFLDQTDPGGQTLRRWIEARLESHVYPPEMASLRQDLSAIRDRIRDGTEFTAPQQAAIIEALMGFDPQRKIRFRSSTNVEDSGSFTGAGLYDSYSGCLQDDLDGDAAGPSHCDPMEPRERGVFRALKKVFASFYNDNAYLERLRHGIAEPDVGMAVLVHHSFPDATELANGVATLEVRMESGDPRMFGDMVTQAGAVPVTNPESNARPEVVTVSTYSFGTYFNQQQASDLAPLGGHVLEWQEEYEGFAALFNRVATGYANAHPARPRFLLDFEFKKIVPDRWIVKQVREIPSPDTGTKITPFLLNEPVSFQVFQGERGDVFSNHRLKSRWQFETRSCRLDPDNLAVSLLRNASHELVDNGRVAAVAGIPGDWNDSDFQLTPDATEDGWSRGVGTERRAFKLITRIPREVPASQPPLFTLADFELDLEVQYATPQPALDYKGQPVTVTRELAILVPAPEVTADRLEQTRHLEFSDGAITFDIEFYWPQPSGGATAGYTAPLVQWKRTVITGLTSQPIELHGEYSRTYRPGHHNFTEEYLFEPALEAGLPEAQRQELELRNIRLLHLVVGLAQAPLRILGMDGKFRSVN